jgi:hypothetical protein
MPWTVCTSWAWHIRCRLRSFGNGVLPVDGHRRRGLGVELGKRRARATPATLDAAAAQK